MSNQNHTGITRITNACKNSAAGFHAAWKHEEAFRQEVILLLIAGPLGYYFGNTRIEQSLLIGSIILILIVELLNTAVEAAIDRIGLEHHELSGRAKDMGSAAVLSAMGLAALTWFLILI